MSLQSAGYRLNFDRGEGPLFYFTSFQLQNQLSNRLCSIVQNFTVAVVPCLGHFFVMPF